MAKTTPKLSYVKRRGDRLTHEFLQHPAIANRCWQIVDGEPCGRLRDADVHRVATESQGLHAIVNWSPEMEEIIKNEREKRDAAPASQVVDVPERLWQVDHDGASRPIIQAPDGRWLSVSQFELGRWVSYDKEESDCAEIVTALNLATAQPPSLPSQEALDVAKQMALDGMFRFDEHDDSAYRELVIQNVAADYIQPVINAHQGYTVGEIHGALKAEYEKGIKDAAAQPQQAERGT